MKVRQMTRLNIVMRAETREGFLTTYAPDFLPRGMFVRVRESLPVTAGTRVRFRLLLASGRLLLSGIGVIGWHSCHPVRGFGLQFVDLSQPAERFHRRMRQRRREVAHHAAIDEFCEAPTCPLAVRPFRSMIVERA